MNIANSKNFKLIRIFANILSIVVILAMAFPVRGMASALDSDPPSTVVGIVLPSENERWARDAAELQNNFQATGIEPEILFSAEDSATEKTNVETLISHGIQVLIICPVDANAASTAVEEARAAGVKVISYDRLIRETEAIDFYVTFDGVDVGRAQGQYLIDHAQGSGNPLYLYAGAPWDNNSFLFFEGAWEVLQPKIDDDTFVIKNSSEAVSLQGNPTLTRDEESAILNQITTNWSYDDAMNLAAANLSTVTAADKGNVFILAPNDNTARAIGDTFSADPDVKSYILTGQDAEKDSIQYIIYGRQSMTVFKDLRTLASDAAATAITFLQGNTPASDKAYNNGKIDVPAHASAVVVVDRNNIRSSLIDTGYYQASDFIWHDDFMGPLTEGWHWVNENDDKWEFNNGFLRIYTSPYGTGGENLLLRSVDQGDFSIETRLFFTPDTNFQFAGLVIWQDKSNFLQFGRAFCEYEGAPCVGNGIYFDYTGGETNFATQIENPFNPAEAYLRLERRGEMVRALYSHEGITWTEIGTHWIPPEFQVNGVGLTSAQDFFTEEWDVPADFDYFELTEGWGFLPEGFHDAESGDVPIWACNAYGWAIDPDNRDADIAVEVNVDGTPYFVNAGEYREDLDNAGVCDSGNCGFSTSLWGAITSYETHTIVAYAQDIESGEWVQLYNSPKELTCRTYDIYAYDPLTSMTQQITGLEETDLREKDEYDPTWSPNGKLVAHDVVTSDSHQIYVTDVKTGVSAVLHGTEDGGNDAAWSPNGKWIAFDRRWFGEPNIYIVPATGGERILAVADAFTASWAPNGKRIAFQSNLDHSIRTAPVDGDRGDETTIADYGETPAWSPDGNWIAYSRYGDIWKVQVNIQGKVLGEPIQLTSNPFNDGKPTWSPDSQTIIYDSNFGQDSDLWSIPAAGGTPTWLTGAVVFGEYGPANARNSTNVAYAGFSPNGQAARTWVAAFTYDAGTWDPGSHTYQFWTEGMPRGDERSLYVSSDAPLYDGYALIRPGMLRAQTPDGCVNIDEINPAQETRFYIGWTFDGVYADAATYYESLMTQVRWDSWEPVNMMMHEIFPYTAPVDWSGYTCTFTAP